ncbi:MAG TPA: hypothetical protein VN842_01910, partial [Thermoplasmata archaeon]|nr:hypothetical protein [Thermoplasmata archaeon]
RLPVKVFVDAVSSSTTNFSTWSVKKKGDATFYSTTSDSTAAFVARAGATLQANFVPGTPCSSNCKVTFTEIGIPSTIHGIQVPWGVTFNGSFLGGSFTSISVNGVNSSAVSGSWSVPSPIYSGTPGLYFVATSASGYLYLPYQTSQLIQYVEEAYVVFSVDPLYSGPSVTPSTGLYPIGDNVSISSMGTQSYGFSRWTTSNGSVLSLLAASSASTDLEVTGPGWVNATFSPRMQAVTFTQFGLPAGAVWGVTFNGNYYSAVVKFIGKATTSTLSIPSMPAGSYFWSVTSPIAATRPGEQYAATIPDAVLTDFTDAGQVVVFVTQVRVAFAATGTAGGSILPSTAAFYDDGSTIAISAINGSSATFVSWSASNSGTLFGSTSQPSTYAGIVAPTIIRGSFS